MYIANSGGLPNIMSVSQENKVDSGGMQVGTLYLSSIAYKFRVSPAIEELIIQLLTCAAETDAFTGTAHMEHGAVRAFCVSEFVLSGIARVVADNPCALQPALFSSHRIRFPLVCMEVDQSHLDVVVR